MFLGVDMSACMNCKKKIDGAPSVFQGVIICQDCFTLVNHVINRTKNELKLLFLTYTDMLRVALIRGELRPPVLPKDKTMPKEALLNSLSQLREELRDRSKIQASEGEVRPLRDREIDPVGTP